MASEKIRKAYTSPWITCVCGKRGYPSRSSARKVRTRGHSDASSLHAYRCDDDPTLWHLGHMPAAVKRGEIDRHTYYDREATG